MVIKAKSHFLVEYFRATRKAIRASIWRNIRFQSVSGYSKVTVHMGKAY